MAHWESKTIASTYATFRPNYPPELFAHVMAVAGGNSRSDRVLIDVGCGSGQAIKGLYTHFGHSIGSDISASQLSNAFRPTGDDADAVSYVAGTDTDINVLPKLQERYPDPPGPSVTITVAQAMHWFNLAAFNDEAVRILTCFPSSSTSPNSLCVWLYTSCDIPSHPAVNQWWSELDRSMMSLQDWPEERIHIDNQYVEVYPKLTNFNIVETQRFFSESPMPLEFFVGYLGTMSGVQRRARRLGIDVPTFQKQATGELLERMGEGSSPGTMLTVRFNFPFTRLQVKKPQGGQ